MGIAPVFVDESRLREHAHQMAAFVSFAMINYLHSVDPDLAKEAWGQQPQHVTERYWPTITPSIPEARAGLIEDIRQGEVDMNFPVGYLQDIFNDNMRAFDNDRDTAIRNAFPKEAILRAFPSGADRAAIAASVAHGASQPRTVPSQQSRRQAYAAPKPSATQGLRRRRP
jgi:hypothetical protein